jgi:Domain of unknown function (DUF1905)
MAAIDKTFTGTLQRSEAKAAWTYLVTDWSTAFFGTRGTVKVAGTIEGEPFTAAFMALGDGTHKLPLRADLRARISKQVGDIVTVQLTDRIDHQRPAHEE